MSGNTLENPSQEVDALGQFICKTQLGITGMSLGLSPSLL